MFPYFDLLAPRSKCFPGNIYATAARAAHDTAVRAYIHTAAVSVSHGQFVIRIPYQQIIAGREGSRIFCMLVKIFVAIQQGGIT